MVVESSVEVVMYVEKAAMEDFINTKDTLEKIIMLPTVSFFDLPSAFSQINILYINNIYYVYVHVLIYIFDISSINYNKNNVKKQ